MKHVLSETLERVAVVDKKGTVAGESLKVVEVDKDLMFGIEGDAMPVDDGVAVVGCKVRLGGMNESTGFHEVAGQHGGRRGFSTVHHREHLVTGLRGDRCVSIFCR